RRRSRHPGRPRFLQRRTPLFTSERVSGCSEVSQSILVCLGCIVEFALSGCYSGSRVVVAGAVEFATSTDVRLHCLFCLCELLLRCVDSGTRGFGRDCWTSGRRGCLNRRFRSCSNSRSTLRLGEEVGERWTLCGCCPRENCWRTGWR